MLLRDHKKQKANFTVASRISDEQELLLSQI